jgi:glutamine amidotransferase
VTSTVALLDYGSGNLRSAFRALARTGASVELTADLQVAAAADGLVVPGVGAFAACMDGLRGIGGVELIRDLVAAGRPVLGICVGFQILFEAGIEHGVEATGCGVLPGVVERLDARRLPHMGWNTVTVPETAMLFERVAGERFYFVHSYGVRTAVPGATTWCEHEDNRFVAAVEHGSVSGTQFHPEKSGEAGARLLRNWVETLG